MESPSEMSRQAIEHEIEVREGLAVIAMKAPRYDMEFVRRQYRRIAQLDQALLRLDMGGC